MSPHSVTSRRIVVRAPGGPGAMELIDCGLEPPAAGEVRVRHSAVGINMADTYFRSGLYPARPPFGLGVEAAGTIEEVGAGVSGFAVGDRVTYTGSPLGAYSDVRNMPVDSLIRLPDAVGFDVAAASTMRGLTASYLLHSIWPLEEGDTVVMHAAAGGVGLIFTQMAVAMGLRVIGTVGSDAKAEAARSAGCALVINNRSQDVAAEVRGFTGGRGARMVVDGVGRDTFDSSLASVARRGLLVCLGTSSGPVAPFAPPQLMAQGSVYVTRPAMADYISDPEEKSRLVGVLLGHLTGGTVKVAVNQRWRLEEAAAAHEALESGATTGSSIFDLAGGDGGRREKS